MEKKRKMPARAAARVEQVSKKRTSTPPDARSATPVPTPPATTVEEPLAAPPPQPLPKSVQPGKPLPVVEDAQTEDLPNKDYQTIQESGVLGESLQRSRQKWISDGIFEKYWAKPTKRKGVVIEEPNNPPKDSMSRLGPVTVTVEPHVFDAVMYAVKDPKPPAPPPAKRPIIQYGPPNGTMPPPSAPTPTPAPSTPVARGTQSPTPTPAPAATTHPAPPRHDPERPTSAAVKQDPERPQYTATPSETKPAAGAEPRPTDPSAVAPAQQDQKPQTKMPIVSQPSPVPPTPVPNLTAAASQPSFPSRPTPPPSSKSTVNGVPAPAPAPAPIPAPGLPPPPAPAPAGSETRPPAGNHPTDPIIAMLACKANEDEELREMMRRVAQGRAAPDELESFQALIDRLSAETRGRGSTQAPSASKLIVSGRTVRYFADEVRAILDIVLTTNPRQTSADLRPPAKSDPLVVQLVRAALDEPSTRNIVRRIAEDRPQFTDATDLKAILDKLEKGLAKESEQQQKASNSTQGPASGLASSAAKANGVPNGSGAVATPAPQQALRSKGPPPAPKPDISAVVFEFVNGTGDRYLFPKFSILETVQGASGPQVMASFLIVRKGSTSEYGGDPSLDYYQPVTIRLQSTSPKLLDHLQRVVASPEEVKRYMDDVMDNMTRAEYVLLAMRLPRDTKDAKEGGSDNKEAPAKPASELEAVKVPAHEGVLWTAKANASSAATTPKPAGKVPSEDEQYQKFISSVTPMETDDA